MEPTAGIFVAGHRGLVGTALVNRLREAGYSRLLLRTREELDLTRALDVEAYFRREKPDYVFLAAARVGGIQANQTWPGDFIRENLLIQTSVLEAARRSGVKRLMFFGSSCLYPRDCPQPMKEESIGTGAMEKSSEAYSAAKFAGYVMCDAYNRQYGTDFVTVIPSTLYGPHDDFDPQSSHVLSALLRRFHEHRSEARVEVWGSGRPVREFLYVDDLAEACLFLMNFRGRLPAAPINVGTGRGVSIRELAEAVAAVVGFRGTLVFDPTKPDGAPEKVLDSSRMRSLGWASRTSLSDGLKRTYEWYLSQN
jgi:GDP-L-fucose synthase